MHSWQTCWQKKSLPCCDISLFIPIWLPRKGGAFCVAGTLASVLQNGYTESIFFILKRSFYV